MLVALIDVENVFKFVQYGQRVDAVVALDPIIHLVFFLTNAGKF